jgi:hypothetical protein
MVEFAVSVLYQALNLVAGHLMKTARDGIIGNRADAAAGWALKKGWRALQELRTSNPNLNHDLQRSLRKAYLLATQEMVRQSEQRLGGLLASDLKQDTQRISKAIEGELNGLHKALPDAELGDADLLVLDESIAPRARWDAMRASQRALLVRDVSRWLDQKAPPPIFDELLDGGWHVKLESGESVHRDWHELISIAFVEELKSEPRVRAVFESRILAELKNRDPQLAPVGTFAGFQDAFDRVHPPLQRIEKGVAAIQQDVSAIRKGVEEMGRKLEVPARSLRWVWAAAAMAAVALASAWFLRPTATAPQHPTHNKLEVSGEVKQETGAQSPAVANTQTRDINIRYGASSEDKSPRKDTK